MSGKPSPRPPPGVQPPRGIPVGDVVVPKSAERIGVVDPRLYDDLFSGNFSTWVKKYGACPLGQGVSKACDEKSTFNVFPPEKNPSLEYDDVSEEAHDNVIGEVAEGAAIESAVLPYLGHEATEARPTLLMFSVTGHVFPGIYFRSPRGGVLHLLNPWPLGNTQQIRDVFTLLETNLKTTGAKNIVVVDVAKDVEAYTSRLAGKKAEIDLQENEKVGFCTLWVGILSHAVLTTETDDGTPPMTFLQSANAVPAVGDSMLNDRTLGFYSRVYTRLRDEKDALEAEARTLFGKDKCGFAAAAFAATRLAARAARGGKRTVGRRTRKKRPKWKRRDPRSSSTVRRTRRSARKHGNAI